MPTDDSLNRARAVLAANPTTDLHSHLGYWEGKGLTDIFDLVAYQGDDKLGQNVQQMVAAPCKSVYLCVTSDNPLLDLSQPGNKKRDYQLGEAWQEYRRQRALVDEFCERFPMRITTDADGIESIHAAGELAVLLTTEGGHMVEDDPSRLDRLYADGVHRFQPVHYAHSKLGDSQTDPAMFGGLSPVGKEAIRYAVGLGMAVDAAHASFEAAADMADLVAGPLILSHTMMKYDSERFGSYLDSRPRFITRRHAFLIAETGGVIGTWTCGVPYGVESLEAFAEAVCRMVDTVGIDHVGWATDYINPAMPDWFDDYEKLPQIGAALIDAGFSDGDLAKFFGGNAFRVLREVAR